MSKDFLKAALERKASGTPPDDPAVYRAFKAGSRPQMGFTIQRHGGDIDGFLYHNLDNISLQRRNNAEFLCFTHRGKAVTMQGHQLHPVMQAIMAHTLTEIHEQDERPLAEPEQTVITRIEITETQSSQPPARDIRLVK